MPDLLTPEETASILRTSAGTLKTWRSKGRYPTLSNTVEEGGAVIKRGRTVLYNRARVEAFAASSQAVG